MNHNLNHGKFVVGDVVRYSWQYNECGIVLEIGAPYQDNEGKEYLYVLWSHTDSSRVKWWVPIDCWVVKC